MTVSAPQWTDQTSFSTSSSMLEEMTNFNIGIDFDQKVTTYNHRLRFWVAMIYRNDCPSRAISLRTNSGVITKALTSPLCKLGISSEEIVFKDGLYPSVSRRAIPFPG